MFSAIFTSMHGVPPRQALNGDPVGQAWIETCVRSWSGHSPRVVSVSEKAPTIDNIEWIEVDSRPSIKSIINFMASTNAEDHSIYCNADVYLGENVADDKMNFDKYTLYIANRVDFVLDSATSDFVELRDAYIFGFDVFIFPHKFLSYLKDRDIIPEIFKVGYPWWDYVIPVLAVYAGFSVVHLPNNPPTALHYLHQQNYEHEKWLSYGQIFLAMCRELLKSCSREASVYLAEIILSYEIEGSEDEKLASLSQKVISLF